MDWWSVVLGSISGGLAALIAELLIARRFGRRVVYIIVLAIAFIAVHTASRQFILPEVHEWWYARELDHYLRQNTFYRLVIDDHPELRGPLKKAIVDSVRHRKTTTKTLNEMREVLGPLFPKYVPKASDGAVVQFTATMVEVLEELSAYEPNVCFRFLFPQVEGPVDTTEYLHAAVLANLMDAMSNVIENGLRDPQRAPDMDTVQPLIEKFNRRLVAKHGDDVAVLAAIGDPTVDRRKVCSMVVAVYTEALILDDPERGLLLRGLFSQASS